jgi:CheY-like chemotaxis protein
MSNAVKFTERGAVRVTLSEERAGAMVLLRLEVSDTGPGLSQEDLPRLFDQYSQLDASLERRAQGSGLGLAISNRLATLMEGRLGVHSGKGMGSTFWLELTLPEACEAGRLETRPPAPAARQGKARVLVVEDNAISQRLVLRMLEKLGCEADAAGDGKAALEKLKLGGWDTVLMDWRLPDTTGLELTRMIRSLEGNGPQVPVIALTANAMQGDREACIEAGMSDYLTKPIELDRLREAIERWSRRSVSTPQDT